MAMERVVDGQTYKAVISPDQSIKGWENVGGKQRVIIAPLMGGTGWMLYIPGRDKVDDVQSAIRFSGEDAEIRAFFSAKLYINQVNTDI